MTLQLTRSALRVGGAEALSALRSRFERRHFVRLPGFLAEDLLATVQAEIVESDFRERTHEGIGENKELCLNGRATAAGLLHLLLNGEELFAAIRAITGVPTIGCFKGRVYRVAPGCGHRDAWHSDMAANRLVAMSVNLSSASYRGAALQMRAVGARKAPQTIPNTGPGDAILFRISRELEHRITEIEGRTSKTAFAGWFQSEPDFRTMFGLDRVRPRGRRAP